MKKNQRKPTSVKNGKTSKQLPRIQIGDQKMGGAYDVKMNQLNIFNKGMHNFAPKTPQIGSQRPTTSENIEIVKDSVRVPSLGIIDQGFVNRLRGQSSTAAAKIRPLRHKQNFVQTPGAYEGCSRGEVCDTRSATSDRRLFSRPKNQPALTQSKDSQKLKNDYLDASIDPLEDALSFPPRLQPLKEINSSTLTDDDYKTQKFEAYLQNKEYIKVLPEDWFESSRGISPPKTVKHTQVEESSCDDSVLERLKTMRTQEKERAIKENETRIKRQKKGGRNLRNASRRAHAKTQNEFPTYLYEELPDPGMMPLKLHLQKIPDNFDRPPAEGFDGIIRELYKKKKKRRVTAVIQEMEDALCTGRDVDADFDAAFLSNLSTKRSVFKRSSTQASQGQGSNATVSRVDSKMLHDNQYVSLFGVEGLKIRDYRKTIHKPSTLLLGAPEPQPPAVVDDLKVQDLSVKEESAKVIEEEKPSAKWSSEIADSSAVQSQMKDSQMDALQDELEASLQIPDPGLQTSQMKSRAGTKTTSRTNASKQTTRLDAKTYEFQYENKRQRPQLSDFELYLSRKQQFSTEDQIQMVTRVGNSTEEEKNNYRALFEKELEKTLHSMELRDGKKASFLQYKQIWMEERVGDYLGPKIPSLLEFLENKIYIRDTLGTSVVQPSGRGPKPLGHQMPKRLKQEQQLGALMRDKDRNHANVIFESEQPQFDSKSPGQKSARPKVVDNPIIKPDVRNFLARLNKNKASVNGNIHAKILESMVFKARKQSQEAASAKITPIKNM